jgi:prepilin-type N-terminal cleavage/methylation domain-containing protein
MKRQIPLRSGRRGFTLIEMLVVITLFMVLAGLTVAFLANFRGSAASQGTSQVYNWLSMAKQRAIRDRNPYGVRLIPDATGNFVSELQYIEQPEDYHALGGTYTGLATNATLPAPQKIFCPQASPPNNYFLLTFASEDFTGGFPSANSNLFPVQPGDYVEVNGAGKVHRIASGALGDVDINGNPVNGVNFNSASAATGNKTGLVVVGQVGAGQPDAPVPASGAWQYRVIRQPRVVGEDALRLPQGVIINLQQVYTVAVGPPPGPYYGPKTPLAQNQTFDILFGAKGQVVGSAAAYDKIILWIHETTGAPSTDAVDATRNPNLIVINTRSGAIASYNVNTDQGATDPYSETRTGQTSP